MTLASSQYVLLNYEMSSHLKKINYYTEGIIDLAFASPNLEFDSEWFVDEDLCGGDHFSATITLNGSNPNTTVKEDIIQLAHTISNSKSGLARFLLN